MNNLLRIASKSRFLVNPAKKIVTGTSIQQRQLARNLWYMCNSRPHTENFSKFCTCGCLSKHVHTKGNIVLLSSFLKINITASPAEKNLIEHLTEEILLERKSQKSKTLPTELDGFDVNLNAAKVTLTKKIDDETVKITFSVSHTINTDEPEIESNTNSEIGELRSQPDFTVDIIRGNTTLQLNCSYTTADERQEGYGKLQISFSLIQV